MYSLLLIISFLLHFVLILVVYFLYQQLQQTKKSREKELESLFARFLDEIKQENEALESKLGEENKQPKKEIPPHVPHESETVTVQDLQQQRKPEKLQALQVEKQDKIETSVESQIFQLYKSGQSVEQIAKKLNRGKTEVELILKLQKKLN